MAGYSKGIVDTRKLNKDSKAKLGRGGDTKIREVDGKESHVNALEAYLIDVNGKAGEDYAKRVGAGTVNPLTGMPEYQEINFDRGEYMRILQEGGNLDDFWAKSGIKPGDKQFFESAINEEYLGEKGFIEQKRAETFRGAETAYELGTEAAGAQYELGMEGAGMSAGAGLMKTSQQADIATSRSGLATSGTISTQQSEAEGSAWDAYKMQGKELAESKRGTLAGLTEARRTTRAGANLAAKTAISDIGFGAEQDFWDTASELDLGVTTQSTDPNAAGYEQAYSTTWRPSQGKWGVAGQSGATKTCVLSTAAYQQDLITKEQLMSFVKWRLKVQSKKFLSNQTWLGYQITWKPISNLMLRYKSFAKLITNTLLKGWMNVIAGKKGYITRLIIEGTSLIGYILNRKKALALGKILMANPKAILQAYKDLIRSKELEE